MSVNYTAAASVVRFLFVQFYWDQACHVQMSFFYWLRRHQEFSSVEIMAFKLSCQALWRRGNKGRELARRTGEPMDLSCYFNESSCTDLLVELFQRIAAEYFTHRWWRPVSQEVGHYTKEWLRTPSWCISLQRLFLLICKTSMDCLSPYQQHDGHPPNFKSHYNSCTWAAQTLQCSCVLAY